MRLVPHVAGEGARTKAMLGGLCLLSLVMPGQPASVAELPLPALLSPTRQELLKGQADHASRELKSFLQAQPSSGVAHLLLCRVYLSEELADNAVEECQAALANGLSQNSEAQDWTGRALGQRGARAGMFCGLKLAFAVKSAFEAAFHLDPASEAACIDLGEYDTTAPAIVGGGSDRALALAQQIEGDLPEVAHRIRAMTADKDKDAATAEREFQAEVAVAHHPGALVDLAAFYRRHGRTAEAVRTAQQAIASDHAVDSTVVEAAGILSDAKQFALAEQTLSDYLTHGTQSDQAPTFRVHTILGAMLERDGDKEAARQHFQQALVLAPQYALAQKGLASL